MISCDPETFLAYAALPNKKWEIQSISFSLFWFFAFIFYLSEFVQYKYFLLISVILNHSCLYKQAFYKLLHIFLLTDFLHLALFYSQIFVFLFYVYFVPHQLGATYWLTDLHFLLTDSSTCGLHTYISTQLLLIIYFFTYVSCKRQGNIP